MFNTATSDSDSDSDSDADDGDDAPIAPTTPRPTPHLPALWRFARIPAAVAPPRGITGARPATIARDRTCRVTQYAMGVEVAHLVPKEADKWFVRNMMKFYSKPPDDSSIDHPTNRILLRGNVYHMLDRRELVILPKKVNGRYCFVLKVIKSGQDYLYDAFVIDHNRVIHDFLCVSIEYLLGRFAWNILHPETMPVLLSARSRQLVRFYDSSSNEYKVGERLLSDFKSSRSESRGGGSQGGGSQAKRRRSSGPGDDDTCSLDSDNTLTISESDSDDEDSYEERLRSLDDYKACLAALEGGEVTRGRKRYRRGQLGS
ncbi:hypothetical protein F4818DRAFT_400589 [Hypoxylon cercidicola]|nr:hypothetical protein F4818DRAFT_400589 [Hypoxylon cercidicola]